MQDVTMTTPGLMKMTHVAYCGVRSPLDSAKLRRAYEYVVEAWTRLGIPPQSVGYEGADFAHPLKGYTFKRGRKKFEAVDPAECKSFHLGLPIPGKDERGGTWPMAQFDIKRCYGETTVWNPFLGVHPPATHISYEEAERHALEFAGIVAGSYGFIVRRRSMVAITFFWAGGTIAGGDFDPETQEEHSANIGRYG